MPPKVKYQKDEIVKAALEIAEKKGFENVTARTVAVAIGGSVAPIFTCFENMDDLRLEVYKKIKDEYYECIRKGLEEPVPFLGVWKQYGKFAKEKPELYKTLFFTPPIGIPAGSGSDLLRYSQDLVRPSIMNWYRMSAEAADKYFRDMWLVSYGISAMIMMGDCPFSDEEVFELGTEISLSLCKAFKEIPGFDVGGYDKNQLFKELALKNNFTVAYENEEKAKEQ